MLNNLGDSSGSGGVQVGVSQGGVSGSSKISYRNSQGTSNLPLLPSLNPVAQPGPRGFVLVGFEPSGMVGTHAGSSLRLPKF